MVAAASRELAWVVASAGAAAARALWIGSLPARRWGPWPLRSRTRTDWPPFCCHRDHL